MSRNIVGTAEKALERQLKLYGEDVRLLKYVHNATGGIYRQSKKIYESPYVIRACIARIPFTEELGRIGEESLRTAEATIPARYLRSIFPDMVELHDVITTHDLIVFDNRVWRITQSGLTGRVGDRPLVLHLLLREKLNAKEEDYA